MTVATPPPKRKQETINETPKSSSKLPKTEPPENQSSNTGNGREQDQKPQFTFHLAGALSGSINSNELKTAIVKSALTNNYETKFYQNHKRFKHFEYKRTIIKFSTNCEQTYKKLKNKIFIMNSGNYLKDVFFFNRKFDSHVIVHLEFSIGVQVHSSVITSNFKILDSKQYLIRYFWLNQENIIVQIFGQDEALDKVTRYIKRGNNTALFTVTDIFKRTEEQAEQMEKEEEEKPQNEANHMVE
jgi:hypothetical protein